MENQNPISIKFEDYIVESFNYKMNPMFDAEKSEHKLSMSMDIRAIINYSDDHAMVNIIGKFGNETDDECPFVIDVDITGIFILSFNEDRDMEEFAPNLIAILFPYLRSLVSSISEKNNVFPLYTVPVMNIYQMLKEEGTLEIIDSRNK